MAFDSGGLEAGAKSVTTGIVVAVEFVAVLIIVGAVIQAAWSVLGSVRDRSRHDLARIRIRLGRGLTLALEFALAGDILRTVVAPTWNDIAKVAAIAVIRTALNVVLERDIDQLQRREGDREGRPGAKLPGG